jgi:hypothetical protein
LATELKEEELLLLELLTSLGSADMGALLADEGAIEEIWLLLDFLLVEEGRGAVLSYVYVLVTLHG